MLTRTFLKDLFVKSPSERQIPSHFWTSAKRMVGDEKKLLFSRLFPTMIFFYCDYLSPQLPCHQNGFVRSFSLYRMVLTISRYIAIWSFLFNVLISSCSSLGSPTVLSQTIYSHVYTFQLDSIFIFAAKKQLSFFQFASSEILN